MLMLNILEYKAKLLSANNKIQKPIKIKLKQLPQSRPSNLSKSLKTNKSKLTFSMLGMKAYEKLGDNQYEVATINEIQPQKVSQVFYQIADKLIYPKELVKHHVKGHVKTRIFFDKDGYLQFSRLRLKGTNRYLRAHIARTIRKSFKNFSLKPLKKMTAFDLLFEFELTPKGRDEEYLLSDAFYFKRWNYGTSSPGDKLTTGISKALVNITNWFSLLEYLPETKGAKHRQIRELEKYERDAYF